MQLYYERGHITTPQPAERQCTSTLLYMGKTTCGAKSAQAVLLGAKCQRLQFRGQISLCDSGIGYSGGRNRPLRLCAHANHRDVLTSRKRVKPITHGMKNDASGCPTSHNCETRCLGRSIRQCSQRNNDPISIPEIRLSPYDEWHITSLAS